MGSDVKKLVSQKDVTGLMQLLAVDKEKTRREAIEGLLEISDPVAVPGLVRVLRKDPSKRVREMAASGLGHFGAKDARVDLVEVFQADAERSVRCACAKSLRHTVDQPDALDALTRAVVGDPDKWVRLEAARALGCSEDPRAAAAVEEALISGAVKPDSDDHGDYSFISGPCMLAAARTLAIFIGDDKARSAIESCMHTDDHVVFAMRFSESGGVVGLQDRLIVAFREKATASLFHTSPPVREILYERIDDVWVYSSTFWVDMKLGPKNITRIAARGLDDYRPYLDWLGGRCGLAVRYVTT